MSLNQLPQHETIAPLIKVCRKLEHCDKHQLSEWIQTFPDIFSQNNSLDLWIKILLKGLCCYHASIPTALFDAILATAPNENALHCLDDSITKSHLNDETDTDLDDIDVDDRDTTEPLTFLQIPKDMALIIFNFLQRNELFQIQKTCRSLNITARDPNALYRCHIGKNNTCIYYSHPFFSRIKVLDVYMYYTWNSKWNSKWGQTVQKLDIMIKLDNPDSIPFNRNDSVPYFENVQTCALSFDAVNVLFRNRIQHYQLNHLSLKNCAMDSTLWNALLRCVNLRELELASIDDISAITPNNVSLPCPFDRLHTFTTDESFISLTNIYSWLLSGGDKTTQLRLTLGLTALSAHGITRRIDLFPIHQNLTKIALQSLTQLILDVSRLSVIRGLLTKLSESLSFVNTTLDYFKLAIHIEYQMLSADEFREGARGISSISSILPLCKSSQLYIGISFSDMENDIDAMPNQWFLKLINSPFSVIKIGILRDRPLFLRDEPESYLMFDDLIDNKFDQDKLDKIATKYGMIACNDYQLFVDHLASIATDYTQRRIMDYHLQFNWEDVVENGYQPERIVDLCMVFESIDMDEYEYGRDMLQLAIEAKKEAAQNIWNKQIIPKLRKVIQEGIFNELIQERIPGAFNLEVNEDGIRFHWDSTG
eukprot:937443_1